jgi:hypothetical protein
MRSTNDKLRRLGTSAALTTMACGLAACGDDAEYANAPRPAAPIVITASISGERVSVSPKDFGAGPVSLIITNQTDSPQEVTFESAGSDAGFRQQTAPINPRDTATLKADVPEGGAVVKVSSSSIKQAKVAVSSARPSAQNDLLQP